MDRAQLIRELSKKTRKSHSIIQGLLSKIDSSLEEQIVEKILPVVFQQGLINNTAQLKEQILYAEHPDACQAGLLNRRVVQRAWKAIKDDQIISRRLFDLLPLIQNNPRIKRYKLLITKQKLSPRETRELTQIFKRFESYSTVAKQYNWNRHPYKINQLAVLELDRLLETSPTDWHWKHQAHIKTLKKGNEPLEPVTINLSVIKGENIAITDQTEQGNIKKASNFIETNEKTPLKVIIRSLNRNFPRTKRINALINKTRHMPVEQRIEKILAEYIKTYPDQARRLLLAAMPIVRGGTKIRNNQDLVTLLQLQEFYHNVIPYFLEKIGMKDFPNPFTKELTYINDLVKKYSRLGKVKIPTKFKLSAGKTLLDNFPGPTGQTCLRLKEFKQDLHDPRFHIIQIINTKTGENEGTIQAYERQIAGKKHLVLNGVEPKARLVRQVDPSHLYAQLISGLSIMAKQGGFDQLSSAVTHGTVSNRGEIDARIKQNKIVTLRRSIKLFPISPRHKQLFQIRRFR